MKQYTFLTKGLGWVAVAAFFLASFLVIGSNDYNVGTDLGIHLGFANEIARVGWPLPPTSFLLSMAHYPPFSHIAGLCAGTLVGSTLRGIFILAAASVVVTYLSISELMRRTSVIGTITAFGTFLVIAVVCRKLRFLEGAEVVENFFFAQFVATSVLLASVVLFFNTVLPFARWLIIAALICHLLGWIYNLAAIEFALICTAFQGIGFLEQPSSRLAWRTLLTLIVLAALVIVHPTMIGALAIAANDGGISIGSYSLLAMFAWLLLGTFLLGFAGRPDDLVNRRTLLALNIGTCTACAAQFLAFKLFGLGSIYATKKYGFLIGTLGVTTWSVLIADRVLLLFSLRRLHVNEGLIIVAACMLGILMLPVLTFSRAQIPLSLQQHYGDEVAKLLEQAPKLAGSTVSWNRQMTPHVNYTAGVGRLRPKQAIIDQHAIFLPEPKLSGAAQFVIIDAGTASAYTPSCIAAATEAIAAIKASCWR